jgi:hypothetical protein
VFQCELVREREVCFSASLLNDVGISQARVSRTRAMNEKSQDDVRAECFRESKQWCCALYVGVMYAPAR